MKNLALLAIARACVVAPHSFAITADDAFNVGGVNEYTTGTVDSQNPSATGSGWSAAWSESLGGSDTKKIRLGMNIRAEARLFTDLVTVQGTPGPPFTFEPRIQVQASDVYPLIAFPLLLALPAKRRVLVGSVALAVPLLALCWAADLAAFTTWMGSDLMPSAWLQIRNSIVHTPENLAVIETLRGHHERWKFVDWFLSTSRPFLAVFAAAAWGLTLQADRLFSRLRRNPRAALPEPE